LKVLPATTRRGWLWAAARLFGAGAAAALPPARAQPAAGGEHQIKAAFLYKFLAFVEWPATVFTRPDAPLVIGVLGAEAMADELAQATGQRQVNGRAVVVRKLQAGGPMAGLHVLFVGRAESPRAPAVLSRAKGQPLLVVSEADDVFAQGSTINFLVIGDKVRFDVALGPAEQAGLKISARLLAVARRVLPVPS
jgi:hypothetical protein